MKRLTLLLLALVACADPSTATAPTVAVPHRASASHLSGGLSAAFAYQCLPQDHGICTFDASASSGPIAEYVWAWGDGSWSAGAVPLASHQYADGGRYSVVLCVTATPGSCWQWGGVYDSRERPVRVR